MGEIAESAEVIRRADRERAKVKEAKREAMGRGDPVPVAAGSGQQRELVS